MRKEKAEIKRMLFVLAVTWLAGAALASQTVRIEFSPWLRIPATGPDAWPDESRWVDRASVAACWKTPDGKAIPQGGKNAPNCIWLRSSFIVPEGWEKDRLRLDFHGFDSYGILFLNGKRVGELLHPSDVFDITCAVSAGTNTIQIYGTRDYTGISLTPETDPLRDGARGVRSDRRFAWHEWPWPAVNGPVDLVRLPRPVAVVDAFVKTSVRRRRIEVDVDLDASESVGGIFSRGATVACDIYDGDFNCVKRLPAKTIDLDRGACTVTLSDEWKDAKLWDIGQPNLYRAVVAVSDPKGKVVDSKTFRFGFREVWTEGRHVILNGHVQRFRIEGGWFGLCRNSLGLWKALGRNMMLDQPHPNKWWYFSWWHDCPVKDDDLIDICDTEGIALQLPVPTVNRVVGVFEDPLFKPAYRREAEAWIKRFRNNPSVILWAVSMNFFNPKDGIHPDLLGRRTTKIVSRRQEIAQWALKEVKAIDPTRLVYTHADGNIGDIASGNCYPNITPVQEVRDYLELWAKDGDMPYLASEYDAPYDGTYNKANGFPALAEIYAINRGPEAYDLLSEAVATNYLAYKAGAGYGGGLKNFVKDDPCYWGVQGLYVEATDRHWRMDGATGWHYFHGANYGKPAGVRSYRYLKEPFAGHPDWLSPNFDLNAKNAQSFLAFIGGTPRHSDRTHSYWGGSEVEKSVCLVWDGSQPLELDYALTLRKKGAAGAPRRIVQAKARVCPGDVQALPVAFAVPDVAKRTDFTIGLEVRGWAGKVVTDSFEITVFPKKESPAAKGAARFARTVRLYDPAGKSTWVSRLAVVEEYRPGDGLDPANDLLVIGREALAVGEPLPWKADDIARGLRVLVLEQRPEVFEAFGFRCYEFMPRNVFPGASVAAPLTRGLEAGDLSYWRGSPDILPSFKLSRVHDFSPHPKGSNRHTLASTVFAQPTVPGFLPLLVCEMDLAYSPLLRYADGDGMILFSSLDLTNRADGNDPAATVFVRNLLDYAVSAPVDASREVKVNYGRRAPDTDAFLAKGGRVLNVGFGPEALASCGLAGEKRTAVRPRPDGEMAQFADRRLTYFRAPLEYTAITTPGASTAGMWFRKGNEAFLQPVEAGFGIAATNRRAKANAAFSVNHLDDLVARARTHLGERPQGGVRAAMASIVHRPDFKWLNGWHVIGPYSVDPLLPATNKLSVVHSCEKAALAGDLNPNYVYPNERGENLDFRTSAEARYDGYVDFRKYFKGMTDETSVGYAVKTIEAKSDHDAILRLGFDWYMKVFVNGELAADFSSGLGANPRANMKTVRIRLKKGENVITLKQRAGAGGFGFWANLSEEGMDLSSYTPGTLLVERKSVLYAPGRASGFEYFYSYW